MGQKQRNEYDYLRIKEVSTFMGHHTWNFYKIAYGVVHMLIIKKLNQGFLDLCEKTKPKKIEIHAFSHMYGLIIS